MMMLINSYLYASAALWTPAQITTALWLDAADANTVFTTDAGGTLATNGSSVGRWNDKSGNNVDFGQYNESLRPVYQTNIKNGLSAIYFNTTGTQNAPGRKYLTGSLSYSQDKISLFSVHIHNNGVNSASNYGRIFSFADSTQLDYNNVNGLILAYGVTTGIALYRTNATIATTSAINNTWCLVDAERNAGTGRISLNGNTYTTGTTSTANQAITRARVGSSFVAQGSNDDSGLSGYIAESIVITGALDSTTRQKLQGYLAHKWGLTANLPGDHPYKNSAPTV